MINKAVLIMLFVLANGACMGQNNWMLRKNENGIAVYSRMLSSGKYKEIRVVCEFHASAGQLIKVLQDVNDHKNWVYKTVKSYLVKKINQDTLIYYSEIELPWPVSNRDAVTQLVVARDTGKNFIITVKSVPALLPKHPDLIRVPYSLGVYKVNILPGSFLKIDYTLSVDPGGAIPAWLVNYTATVAPYNTFLKLKALVEK